MAKLKLISYLIFLVLVILLGLAFLLRNSSPVSIDFFLGQPFELTVGLLVVLSFVFGGLVGVLVRVPSAVWQGSKARRREKVIAKQDLELANLKADSTKAS